MNALPIQSRRETRNSTKVAALCKQKEDSPDEIIENNKRKLMYVFYNIIFTKYKNYIIFL